MLLIPEAKHFLNSLKCPICKAPIDLMPNAWKRSNSSHDFGCAADSNHYSLILKQDMIPVCLIEERVHVYDKNKKYQLNKKYNLSNGSITTEIVIYRVDPEGREMFTFEQKRLLLEKDLFDFANFNNEKAVQRIKNILLLH